VISRVNTCRQQEKRLNMKWFKAKVEDVMQAIHDGRTLTPAEVAECAGLSRERLLQSRAVVS
jgi:alkylated DNA nucleotide flippase Atl1